MAKMTKSKDWLHDAVFASWWLTWEDLAWPDPALTEKWKIRAARFQAQGVNTVVMFGLHFRFDYFAHFDRVFGLLREIADICHDHGLRVVEHHSATLVHRVRNEQDRREIRERNFHHVPFYPDSWEHAFYQGERIADWRQISARDGKPTYFERYTCECFCPNNPSYQRCYLDYTRRHLEAVPIDGYMSDDLHYLPDFYSCGCEHCRKRFHEEDGIELPPATDTGFWENFENPDFLKWVAARYRWNGDFYRRLREAVPSDIALWGCASDAIDARVAGIAYSPQHYAPHWDAVFHEIVSTNRPGRDDVKIAADLIGFAGIARQHNKPLIALFYPRSVEELTGWLKTVAHHGARPWISKQPRTIHTPVEEELLQDRVDFPATRMPADEELIGIVFSQDVRDRLGPRATKEYVQPYHELSHRLSREGERAVALFDGAWEKAGEGRWKAIYIPGSAVFPAEKLQLLLRLKETGAHVHAC